MSDDKPPLDYARPASNTGRRSAPIIPPNQSWAGVMSFILSWFVLLTTAAFGLAFIGHDIGLGGLSVCSGVAASLLTAIFALLGVTEEDHNGRRDATLAKWSLYITGACWLVALVLIASRH